MILTASTDYRLATAKCYCQNKDLKLRRKIILSQKEEEIICAKMSLLI